MDRSDFYWIVVTFTWQNDFLFLTPDKTVFFIIFIGQNCLFPKNQRYPNLNFDKFFKTSDYKPHKGKS